MTRVTPIGVKCCSKVYWDFTLLSLIINRSLKNEYEKSLTVTFKEQDGVAAGDAPHHIT